MFIYINITVIVSDTALIDLLMICQFTLYLSCFAWQILNNGTGMQPPFISNHKHSAIDSSYSSNLIGHYARYAT